MNHLLYLSYGTGPHEMEVKFSIMSSRRWVATNEFRVLVYTDHPDVFRDIDADICFIPTNVWDDWAGPQRFAHRRKILALQHAMKNHEGCVVLLDGDTWLREPTESLFDRIGPGRSVMHIREGRISEVNTPVYRRLKEILDHARFVDATGIEFSISTNVSMWNAGVLGLHPTDAPLLDNILDLTDQLCRISDLHVLEQFAFSHVLATRTSLQEAADLVFHYWPPYLHDPFRKKLPLLMKSVAHLPLEQKVKLLFAQRPKPGFMRRSKVVAKRILQFVGFIRHGCRSNEW